MPGLETMLEIGLETVSEISRSFGLDLMPTSFLIFSMQQGYPHLCLCMHVYVLIFCSFGKKTNRIMSLRRCVHH